MRRRWLAFAAVLVAGAVAVNSSSGSDAQTPKRGGTVVVSLAVPNCLNLLLSCGGTGSAGALEQVLEGAFEIDPNLEYRPNLVSRVDVRGQPFALTYHVRPGARWSDGTPVTASDFVFTFQAFRTAEPGRDPFATARSKIRGVSAVDPKTFRVSFRSPYPAWRELFHVVLPRHALLGENLRSVWQKTIDNPKTGEAIGSGPFLVERLEPGRKLTLVRNPRYRGAHTAYLDRIVFGLVESDAVEALRDGQLDVFAASPEQQEGVLALRRSGIIRVVLGPGSLLEHFDLRLRGAGNPALRNPLVRRALAFGIDRGAIVHEALGVIAPKTRPSDSAVFLTQSRFYEPNWNRYRYRPAEARRLLEHAGCRRGADGIRVCGGHRLSLRFLTTGGAPARETTLRLARAQLRNVGVEVVPVFAEPGALFRTILPSGDFDAALFTWVYGADPGRSVDIFRCGGPMNLSGYCDTQVSQELRRSYVTLDRERRAALLNRVDTQLARDVPTIPLYQFPYPVVVRATLRGVAPADPPDYLTWNSEDWWLAQYQL